MGKVQSATGNSIIGRKAFKSRASSFGVTSTCELQRTVVGDGQIINVIDTPESDFVGKEIVECINLAKDGIHAIVAVFSVRTRFSQEEEAALLSLQTLFGSRIIGYMIVVFTGGDELEDNDETLEDYLGRECPDPLKLLSLVNGVLMQNGGHPYTDELFAEVKKGAIKLYDQQVEVNSLKGSSKREIMELKEQMQCSYDDQLKQITEMVESKLKETTFRLEQQLAEEHAARLKAEENAQRAQKESNEEIHKLRENLGMAQKKLLQHGARNSL